MFIVAPQHPNQNLQAKILGKPMFMHHAKFRVSFINKLNLGLNDVNKSNLRKEEQVLPKTTAKVPFLFFGSDFSESFLAQK
jgi:hypothetical protein